MLSKVIGEKQNDWDEWLPHVLLAYRTAVHSTTGITPHRMLFGREARLPVDLLAAHNTPSEAVTTDVPEYVQDTKEKLQHAHEIARNQFGKVAKRYKDYYDSKANGTPYKVGDRVWLYQPGVQKGVSRKLSRPWQGPYTVVKVMSDTVYRIQKDGRAENER